MSTLQDLKHGLHRTREQLAEGWQALVNRATGALTRFHLPRRDSAVETPVEQLEQNASRWSLLPVELRETSDTVEVRMEAPGMNAEDFDISVVDDVLIVSGEKRAERRETQGRYHVIECAYGRFERAVALPAEVDPSRTRASYQRGVLRIDLPKRQRTPARRIEVTAG